MRHEQASVSSSGHAAALRAKFSLSTKFSDFNCLFASRIFVPYAVTYDGIRMPKRRKKTYGDAGVQKLVGYVATYLTENFSNAPEPEDSVSNFKNGHVLYLHIIKCSRSFPDTMTALSNRPGGGGGTRNRITSLINKVDRMKNFSRDSEKQKLHMLCEEVFEMKKEAVANQSDIIQFRGAFSSISPSPKQTPIPATPVSGNCSSAQTDISVRHSRQHPLTPREATLQKKLDFVSLNHHRSLHTCQENLQKQKELTKKRNQVIKKLKQKITEYENGTAVKSLRLKNNNLEAKLRYQKSRQDKFQEDMEKVRDELTNCEFLLRERNVEIGKLHDEIAELEEQLQALLLGL